MVWPDTWEVVCGVERCGREVIMRGWRGTLSHADRVPRQEQCEGVPRYVLRHDR